MMKKKKINILTNKSMEKKINNLFIESGILDFIDKKFPNNELFKNGLLTYFFIEYCDYMFNKYGQINSKIIDDESMFLVNKIIEFGQIENELNKFGNNIDTIILHLVKSTPKKLYSFEIKRDIIKIFFDELIFRHILDYIIRSCDNSDDITTITMSLLCKWFNYISNVGELKTLDNIHDFIIFYYFNKKFFEKLILKYK